MKPISKWRYGTETEMRLLAKCRDIVLGIEPGAEVILYGSRVITCPCCGHINKTCPN